MELNVKNKIIKKNQNSEDMDIKAGANINKIVNIRDNVKVNDNTNINENSNINENENHTLTLFIKVGVIVLSIIMIVGFGIKFLPGAVTVSTSGSKWDIPISCVDTQEQKVALSFDVAYENDDTMAILAILAKHNIKAAFFVTGEWIEKYPNDVKKIAAAGHDLGNHSENHKQISQLSKKQYSDEIMDVHNKVKKLTGVEMNLFRAPYGDYNKALMETTRECGYYTIQWDVDSLDWKDYGTKSIIDEVVDNKNLGNGSIILMHDGAKYTPEALEAIITGLQEKGYEIVPVSELIYTGPYTVDHDGRQYEK